VEQLPLSLRLMSVMPNVTWIGYNVMSVETRSAATALLDTSVLFVTLMKFARNVLLMKHIQHAVRAATSFAANTVFCVAIPVALFAHSALLIVWNVERSFVITVHLNAVFQSVTSPHVTAVSAGVAPVVACIVVRTNHRVLVHVTVGCVMSVLSIQAAPHATSICVMYVAHVVMNVERKSARIARETRVMNVALSSA